MIAQVSLEGQPVEPYKGVCCKACYFAKGDKCTCRCGGQHHGKGIIKDENVKRQRALAYIETFRPVNVIPASRAFVEPLPQPIPEDKANAIRKQITKTQCRWCKADLTRTPIVYRPTSPNWLFIRCPKCYYDHALWKLKGSPQE